MTVSQSSALRTAARRLGGSLRFRVTALAALAVLGVLTAAAAGLVLTHRAFLASSLDQTLGDHADTVVERDARVHGAIIDEGCVVTSGVVVGDAGAAACDDPEQVTIVGRHSRVVGDLPVGSRLEPGTTGS